MFSNGPNQAVLRSLRRTPYSLLLLTAFVLAGFCFHLSSALSCGPCDPNSCQSVPRNCTGGLTTDVCKCCKVCAKVVNETCGGKYGLAGKCDEGLECLPSVEVGESITGHEEGICQDITAKDCANIKCNKSVVKRECPKDSILIHNTTNFQDCCKGTFSCQCNLSSCMIHKCAVGFESVLRQKAAGTPGHCCDVFECTRPEKCASVICSQHVETECPDDSYRLPREPTSDGCCYVPSRCECKKCPSIECLPGLRIQITSKATLQPGRCCSKYHCINETSQKCLYKNHEYHDGESWKYDKCTSCSCRKGLIFCKTETCKRFPMTCSIFEAPEGECCPVCRGCLSDSGQVYDDGDVWMQNSCVTCRCVSGQKQCQAEMCAGPCHNRRTIPGRCCPVCDGDSTISEPDYCPGVLNCHLECLNGLQKSANGCYICRCRPENCSLECKYGYARDIFGRESCECKQSPHNCPTMDACKKQCTYGFKKTRGGCEKCRCNKCPPFNCTKKCVHGYLRNDQGCQLCKCGDAGVLSSTIMPVNTESTDDSGRPCLSKEGHRHEDGESWHDGCRLCYCYNGREMCSLIACLVPRCKMPVFRIGDCCPTCPGMSVMPPALGQRESCQAVNGRHYVEGETWQLDECIHCICHDGSILCETQACPPLLCHYPTRSQHKCCPVCAVGEEDIPVHTASIPRACKTVTGAAFKHGEVWRTSPCQSCTCRYGQIHCFSRTCPVVNCNKTVLRKGQCCPTCIDSRHPEVCLCNGITYSSGEEWVTVNCTKCMCSEGEVVCIPMPCPQLSCTVMVRRPGECCPVCFELPSPGPSMDDSRSRNDVSTVEEDISQDLESDEANPIVIGVLGVVVFVLVVSVAVLVYVVCRQKHSRSWKLKPENATFKEVKPRPKSTNLDFQGAMPIFQGSPQKQYNLDNLQPLLDSNKSPEKSQIISDGNEYILSPAVVSDNDCYKSTKMFEHVC